MPRLRIKYTQKEISLINSDLVNLINPDLSRKELEQNVISHAVLSIILVKIVETLQDSQITKESIKGLTEQLKDLI